MRVWCAFVAIGGLVLASCRSEQPAGPADPCPPLAEVCSSTTVPSYATQIVPIIQDRCERCHTGADGGWTLLGYDRIAAWTHVSMSVLSNCSMPPQDAGAPLTEQDRALFWEWLVCGAPNN